MRFVMLLARKLLFMGGVLLLGGFVGTVLVRYAPGFEIDEREIDPRYGAEGLAAIRSGQTREGVFSLYLGYLGAIARGDLGYSRTLQQPVRELLAERAPVTGKLIAQGLAIGWTAGLLAAAAAALFRVRGAGTAGSLASGVLLSVPAALVAFAVLYWRAPVALCIAGVIFPRVFHYTRAALEKSASSIHVLAAQARGVQPWIIHWRHTTVPVIPQTAALAGVSVSAALGASIPVEVLADVSGIGQLVWKAASGRDLPVLISLTLLVTAVTLAANTVSDMVAGEQEAA
ncbi:MAG: ABC transporter permease subunit [Acidobacteria bacterium]|nr:ABC transporter permease subunit [Acidobacteriota bacterium]